MPSDRTLAELLAMPAGDALDDAIMELRYKELFDKGQFVKRDGKYYAIFPNGKTDLMQRPRCSYWVNDDAAWSLLAEMLAAGVWVYNLFVRRGDGALVLQVGDDKYFHHLATVPTIADAPLAIVRAWLSWKMGGAA